MICANTFLICDVNLMFHGIKCLNQDSNRLFRPAAKSHLFESAQQIFNDRKGT